jgi:DNA-binding transcriptional LysR family regulator
MQLNQIDLNLLVVLDSIYAEGSITRAATKLHLTQPAISHSLGRLRLLFDDPLFIRQGRAMVPTPMARSLMEPLRRSLRGLEVALNEVGQFDPAATKKHFTIGLRDGMEPILLPSLMQNVTRSAPYVSINGARFERPELEADLATGRLDLAVDVLLPHGDSIRRRHLANERMVVAARHGHPRANKRLDLPTYLDLGHVVASSRRTGLSLEDQVLARRGLERQIRLRCQNYFAACRVVAETDLLLTIPEQSALVANDQFDNRILPLPFKVPTFDVYLYWHANVEDEPASRWLRAQVVPSLRKMTSG